MDGATDASWVSDSVRARWLKEGFRRQDGSRAAPSILPRPKAWCHERHGLVLPMPDKADLVVMEREVGGMSPGDAYGPATKLWLLGRGFWLVGRLGHAISSWGQ